MFVTVIPRIGKLRRCDIFHPGRVGLKPFETAGLSDHVGTEDATEQHVGLAYHRLELFVGARDDHLRVPIAQNGLYPLNKSGVRLETDQPQFLQPLKTSPR